MEAIDNLPVKFNDSVDSCLQFDQRAYCQMVEQSDSLLVIWKGTKIGTYTNFTLDESQWIRVEGSDAAGTSYFRHIVSSASYLNSVAFLSINYWEVKFKVKKDGLADIVGSFQVIIGDVTHPTVFSAEGEYSVYLNPTVSGKLRFYATQPFNGLIGEIKYIEVSTDYITTAVAFDGGVFAIEPLVQKINDFFYYKTTWAELGLSDGCYQLQVCNEECFLSTCYDLKSTHPCTKLLTWTNDDDAFGLPYSSIELIHNLRINAIIEKPRYPEDSDIFLSSEGDRSYLWASSQKIWSLFFDYMPEYLHDTIRLAKIHDHFKINGIEYFCPPKDYEPEWRRNLKLAQSTIEIQKKIDINSNYNCA